MRHSVLTFGVIVLTAWLPSNAEAAEASGTVVASVPSTRAQGVSGERTLHTSSDVFLGDRIVTGRYGEAQIRLADDTRLVVGPNSKLLIDEFVFAGNGQASKVTLSAVRGAFRFITGRSRKTAYRIKAPSATIGIRGTEFDFTIDSSGALKVALLSGAMDLCDRNRRCIRLEGQCTLGEVSLRRRPKEINLAAAGVGQIGETFPYIRSQSRLFHEFRVSSASSCRVQRAQRGIDPVTTGSVPPAVAALPSPGTSLPTPTPTPTPTPGPSGDSTDGGNKGLGNGGDSVAEGENEQQNPGKASSAPGHNKS